MTDFDKLLAGLEPAATNGESEWPNVAHLSVAVSLKRIADMMEEDRKPRLELLPEGIETVEDKRHREFMEGREKLIEDSRRQTEATQRIADALWGTDGTSGLLQLLNPLDVRNNY